MSGITNFYSNLNGDIYVDNHRDITFNTGWTGAFHTGGTWTGITAVVHYTGETFGGGIVTEVWSGGTNGIILSSFVYTGSTIFGGAGTNYGTKEQVGEGLSNKALLKPLSAITNTTTYILETQMPTYYIPSFEELKSILAVSEYRTFINAGSGITNSFWSSSEMVSSSGDPANYAWRVWFESPAFGVNWQNEGKDDIPYPVNFKLLFIKQF